MRNSAHHKQLLKVLILFVFLFNPSMIYAQDLGPDPAGLEFFENLVIRLINISVPLAFMVLTVVLFYGGFKFITSGGDQKKLSLRPSARYSSFTRSYLLSISLGSFANNSGNNRRSGYTVLYRF